MSTKTRSYAGAPRPSPSGGAGHVAQLLALLLAQLTAYCTSQVSGLAGLWHFCHATALLTFAMVQALSALVVLALLAVLQGAEATTFVAFLHFCIKDLTYTLLEALAALFKALNVIKAIDDTGVSHVCHCSTFFLDTSGEHTKARRPWNISHSVIDTTLPSWALAAFQRVGNIKAITALNIVFKWVRRQPRQSWITADTSCTHSQSVCKLPSWAVRAAKQNFVAFLLGLQFKVKWLAACNTAIGHQRRQWDISLINLITTPRYNNSKLPSWAVTNTKQDVPADTAVTPQSTKRNLTVNTNVCSTLEWAPRTPPIITPVLANVRKNRKASTSVKKPKPHWRH